MTLGPAGPHSLFDDVRVFQPFPECPEVVFGRIAARSEAFAPNAAAGGACVVVGSAAGSSAWSVTVRARGELLERMSNILAGRAAEAGPGPIATFDELRRRRVPALDPAAWPEPWGAQDPRRVPLLWVAGQSLTSAEEILVPAGAVYLQHRPPAGCSPLLRAGSAGVSAHVSHADAVGHALLEVLERDLVWRGWYETGATRVARHTRVSPALAGALDRLELQLAVLALPGPVPTACVVACLHADERRRQSFGARCAPVEDEASLIEATEVAVYEALMVRWSMGTPVAQRAWPRLRGASQPVLPRDALEHALWAFHAQDSLGHWLAKAAEPRRPPQERCGSQDAASGGLPVRRLGRLVAEHTGEDVVAVDTTTAAVRGDGLTVIRIVAPGARRLPGDERRALPSLPGGGLSTLPHPFG